ncbi:transposable element Tcb2 transposase [Trichonephila clavipes]|nr:transposable element Tcb2 transposase [Trichonephila clavipes]
MFEASSGGPADSRMAVWCRRLFTSPTTNCKEYAQCFGNLAVCRRTFYHDVKGSRRHGKRSTTPLKEDVGTAIRGFSSGRPRGTTPADDRYIVLKARRNRRQTAGEIARHTTQATGRPIPRFTVARRLHGGGLFARRPVRCVPLTTVHRRRRSLWCREHRDWRDNEWGRVLFTDESRFSLSSDSHRILIWRERGSRNHPSNIIQRDRYGGRGVLV